MLKRHFLRSATLRKATKAEKAWAYYEAYLKQFGLQHSKTRVAINAYETAFAADIRDGHEHPVDASFASHLASILMGASDPIVDNPTLRLRGM